MANRTQIVCLCEGERGRSIDEVFINKLIKTLEPGWLRPWPGSNTLRLMPCESRGAVIKKMPDELRKCLSAGGNTTLMVWADCDEDCADGEALKAKFWEEAKREKLTREQFEQIVFIFAKDRLENWTEFLLTGKTDESKEGPRNKHNREVAEAARKLADACKAGKPMPNMPQSLQWSCRNWLSLAKRMKTS